MEKTKNSCISENDKHIAIHRLSFKAALSGKQTPAFRGAIIKAMGEAAHPLMHNHLDNGLRFAYPMVQYKIIDGCPTILTFGEEGVLLNDFFSKNESFDVSIRGKNIPCHLQTCKKSDYIPVIDVQPNYYSIADYLPLTDDNVQEYDSLMALTDKICLLEKIMTGNILSFFKGIDYHVDEQIVCVITSIERQHTIKYKGVHFRAFDMHFVSNVLLPDYIGLGKSTSIGMGTIKRLPLPKEFLKFTTNEKN